MNDEVLEPEPEETNGDILVFCHPRNVTNLVESLEIEIAHANGTIPVPVLWSGRSRVLHQGVIVLTWHEMIPTAFLQSLVRDHEIFDLVAYSYDVSGNENQNATEQTPSSVCLPG